MPRSTDHIVTTHAGSLPRPDDVVELIWAGIEGRPVDRDALEERLGTGGGGVGGRPGARDALEERLETAVADVVRRQREAGIDLVSDGELSKPGFSNYVNDRFSGFEGRAEFQADDVAPFPNLAMRLFNTPAMAHLVFSNCVDEITVKDPEAV